MTKITAEEAYDKTDVLLEDDYVSAEYSEEIKIITDFIEQHLPPKTFDEVVKAWEVAGYEVHAQENGAIHIFYKNTIQPSDPIFAFSVSGSETDGMISTKTIHFMEELNAINLTIRYLESQKEKEDE